MSARSSVPSFINIRSVKRMARGYFIFILSQYVSYPIGKHNLTLMFNSIETNERFVEDAVEHGNQIPLNDDHKSNEKLSYK